MLRQSEMMLVALFLFWCHLSLGIIADNSLSPRRCEKYDHDKCLSGVGSCDVGAEIVTCKNSEDQCYTTWTNISGQVQVTLKGCFSRDSCLNETHCISTQSRQSVSGNKKQIYCCCVSDVCNQNFYWDPQPDDPPKTHSRTVNSQTELLLTLVWVFISLVFFIITVAVLFYCYRRRKLVNFVELATAESANLATNSPHLNTVPVQLVELHARGRFGAVWKALHGADIVAVKIFPEQDKDSWLTETAVYTLPQMSHENVLQFIGVEKKRGTSNSEFWLITSYHKLGSLSDFLKGNVVSWLELLRIGESIACGLAYLHEELPASKTECIKPSVAHRDFKSKNVLLKSDLTACIADFGLALVFCSGSSVGIEHNQVGTRRYMAPEILEGSISFNKDAFLAVDIYACSLVLWEILSRCTVQGDPVGMYRLPFEDEVGQYPTLEEMQECVVTKNLRPLVPSSLNNSASFELIDTIQYCWDNEGEARLSANCIYARFQAMRAMTP